MSQGGGKVVTSLVTSHDWIVAHQQSQLYREVIYC
jgi:hypothetical protein